MPTRTSEAKALVCRCVLTLSAAARHVIEASGRSAALAPYPPAGEHGFDVLVNDDAARVTRLSGNGKSVWTFVRHARTRAALAWDHINRTAFSFAADDMVQTQVHPARGLRLQTETDGEHVLAQIHLEDQTAGVIRTVLRFSKSTRLKHFGRPLLRILFGGPSCHVNSGFPLTELEALGCLVRCETFIGDNAVPVSRLIVQGFDIVDVGRHDFHPPHGFTVKTNEPPPVQPPFSAAKSPSFVPLPSPGPNSGTFMPADNTRTFSDDEQLTPDCLGSTRFGSMAALVHQDALNHATTIINGVGSILSTAPVPTTAVLNSGTLTLDWLTPLDAIVRGPGGPGTGLACLLRSPRVAAIPATPTTPATPASGGGGLIDRLAHALLTNPDKNGLSRLQREAASGALNNSMRAWGLNTFLIAALFAANGDLSALTVSQQIAILEGYELSELGTLRIPDLPYETDVFDPFKGVPLLEGLIQGKLLSLTGTANFASLAGAALIPTATIGGSGNIAVTVVVPTTTVTATSTWGLTALGGMLFGSWALPACLVFPFACPQIAILFAVFDWILSGQLSVLTGTATGLTISLDIAYKWDPTENLVNPFVTVTGTTGTVAVTPTGKQSAFADLVETILTAVGNQMGFTLALTALGIASALQKGLRDNGLSFPLVAQQWGMAAVSGSAHSASGESLTLLAEIAPDGTASCQPYVTQVPTAETVAGQLETCHSLMRGALNPQPTVSPIPGRPVIKSGDYAAVGVSQNALNYYVYSLWRRTIPDGVFRMDIVDPQAVAALMALVPPGAQIGTSVTVAQIHAWFAVCPRIEIVERALAAPQSAQDLPLLAFFDDIRVCFDGLGPPDRFPRSTIPLGELSFNAKTTATVMLDWPGVFDVMFSRDPQVIRASDERVWEFVDLNQPDIAATLPVAGWSKFATQVVISLLQGFDSADVQIFPNPPAWPRPIPGGRAQEFYPQAPSPFSTPEVSYVEILGRSRALYLPTAVSTSLLELVDGSGAPDLNSLLTAPNMPPPMVSIFSFSCQGGKNLRAGGGAPPGANDLLASIGLGPEHAIPSTLP